MLGLGIDAQLPQLAVQILHKVGYSLLDVAEVMILQLLTLRRHCTEQSSAGEDQILTLIVGLLVYQEVFLLRSDAGTHAFTDRKQPRQLANDVVESLEVVTPGISTPVRRLSGGNVQKVLVGREIASAPTVLLTAYAVRGLDINSSYTIYDLLNQQKKKGVAVIFVGEDLDVLLELSDKILVLCGGKVSGIVDARKTDKNEVGMMMTRVGGSENHE